MTRLLVLTLGSSAGSWLGWWLAGPFGLLGRFLCSNVGFVIGWYYSQKLLREYLDL